MQESILQGRNDKLLGGPWAFQHRIVETTKIVLKGLVDALFYSFQVVGVKLLAFLPKEPCHKCAQNSPLSLVVTS